MEPTRMPSTVRSAASTILVRVGFLAICIGAGVVRLRFLGRPIWTAEAWVANSVIAGSMREMFWGGKWLQTTPPLFLLIERVVVKALGLSNGRLRFLPFALGMVCVVFVAILSRRLFRPSFALFCTALVALSPSAVEYSKELKQYSGDAAATAVILLILWAYVEHPTMRGFWQIAPAFWLALWLSHTVVMLVPLAVAVMALTPPQIEERTRQGFGFLQTRTGRCVCFIAPVLVLGTLNYLVFIRPNVTPHLLAYWRAGYPQFSSLKQVAHFYTENFAGLFLFFFLSAHAKDWMLRLLEQPAALLLAPVFVVFVATIGLLIRRFRTSKRHQYVALFCALPVVTLAVFNMFHLYPVGTRRLMLFLLPCLAIGIAFLAESVWDGLAARLSGSRTQRVVPAVLGVLSAVAVGAGALSSEQWRPFQEEEEDVPAALRYLRLVAKADDLIYVHASLEESAKLDFQLMNWRGARVLYGNTGWPCCIRGETGVPDRGQGEVLREAADIRSRTQNGTVWLLFTDRSGQWGEIQRNDPELLVHGLRDLGCRPGDSTGFSLVTLHRLECGP